MLLSQVRLGVVSVLMSRPEASFSELKALLGVTQGNLGIHLQKLEESGYAEMTKAFVSRKPQTTVRLTEVGRRAFLAHLQRLNEVARQDGAEAAE